MSDNPTYLNMGCNGRWMQANQEGYEWVVRCGDFPELEGRYVHLEGLFSVIRRFVDLAGVKEVKGG